MSDMLSEYHDVSAGLPPSLSLLGKSAIIAGASRGIGSAVALSLASRGANIAITYASDSSTSKAENIAAKVRALGREAIIIKCDVAREDCGKVIVQQALRGFGVEETF
jgi:NAD(P)-dependent dehydrogenase (short-subunit alcohol dehydrogenase family)